MIILISFIAGLSTLVGTYAVKFFKKWTEHNANHLIALAGGIILATSIFELLPESVELNPVSWSSWTVIGFVLFFTLEQFLVMHACTNNDCDHNHSHSHTAVLGIGLHSLVDGLLIGLGFEVNISLGIIASLAVIVHEIPEGIFTYTLLAKANTKKAMLYSWLVALATPIGTIATVLIAHKINQATIGALLALTAGNFIYISCVDLIPETLKKSARLNALLVLAGIVLIYIFRRFIE